MKISSEGWWWKLFIFLVLIAGLIYILYSPSHERFNQRALQYFQAGQFEKAAIEHLKAASELGEVEGGLGRKLDAQLKAAEIYEVHLRNYSSAIKIYEEIFKRDFPPEHVARAGNRLIELYFDVTAMPRKGIQVCQDMVSKFPKLRNIHELKTRIIQGYVKTHDYKQAKVEADDFLEKYSSHDFAPKVALMRAESLSLLSRFEDALEAYSNIKENYPDTTESKLADFEMGNCFMEMDMPKKAIEAYERALPVYPNPEVVQVRIVAAREKIEARQEGRYTRYQRLMEAARRRKAMHQEEDGGGESQPVKILKKRKIDSDQPDAPGAKDEEDAQEVEEQEDTKAATPPKKEDASSKETAKEAGDTAKAEPPANKQAAPSTPEKTENKQAPAN